MAINVDNRTARTASTGGSTSLVIARIKVAISIPVLGRIAIQSADNTRQNTELLAGIVTNDSDLHTHLGVVRTERERLNRHVLVGSGPFWGYCVFDNHEEVDAYPVYRDPVHDFGILKFDPKAIKYMPVQALPLRPDHAKQVMDGLIVKVGLSDIGIISTTEPF